MDDTENPLQCSITYKDDVRGQVVVSVPSNGGDIFWSVQQPTQTDRLKYINTGIDRLVSNDGRTGRIRQLIESGQPVVLVTRSTDCALTISLAFNVLFIASASFIPG